MRADTEAILRRRPAHSAVSASGLGTAAARSTRAMTAFDAAGLECIHTPGHSTDHQVVWDPQTGTLFSGDLWLGVRARVMHSSEDPYADRRESARRAGALARRGCSTRIAVWSRRRGARRSNAKIEWLGETLGDDRAAHRRRLERPRDRAARARRRRASPPTSRTATTRGGICVQGRAAARLVEAPSVARPEFATDGYRTGCSLTPSWRLALEAFSNSSVRDSSSRRGGRTAA